MVEQSEDALNYVCPKRDCRSCEVGEIRAAGSIMSAVFDVESKRFTTVTCTNCKFTEIHKAESSDIAKILDMISG